MPKQTPTGNKGGSSGGKTGSAYESSPSGAPAPNIHGSPPKATKK